MSSGLVFKMAVSAHVHLPTEEELTVPEVQLSGVVLRAAAFHLGKYCENQNNEFMLCRKELDDPRKCINEGKAVTSCALEFLRQLKKTCYNEFVNYYTCIDRSSAHYRFEPCRKSQAVLDKCVKDNMNIERPPFGYFCEPKIHETSRPKPIKEFPVFGDLPGKPDDVPNKAKAKYGSRFNFLID